MSSTSIAETKPGGLTSRLQMLGALQHPQFRNFWFGSLAALAAQQIMTLAQGWLIYDLTDSALYLGYVGLATAIPALILALIGGALADRIDKRRLLFATQVFTAAVAFVLATLTAAGSIEPWHILVAAFLIGSTQAFNNPARQAILPYLIDRKDMMQAIALNSLLWQGTRIIAPALGGVLVAVSGSAVTFYVCTAGYFVFALVVMTLSLKVEQRRASGPLLADVNEGLGYVMHSSLLRFLIGMTFFNSFFGISMLQIMPAFAKEVFDVGPTGLGFMFTAVGLGSVTGLTIASTLGSIERKGLLVIGGATAYGFFLILFALSDIYALSLGLLFVMSAFNQVYMISVQTAIQLRVSDDLRGRVMGIYTMTYNMGPLGAVQAGIVASAFGAPVAVGVGGVAVIAFALLLSASNPEVRRLQAAPSAN